jgi:histidyl-tRNA synthetase
MSDKTKRVPAALVKGFRDFPPEEEIARRELIERIRGVFEKFGFLPLQTPALEHLTTLLGADYGSENRQQIFNFVGPEDTEIGLRFDLTASLARFVAANRELPIPFRRYQVAPVWRVDKPGPGRYREFLQFDIDIVGTSLVAADAEIIAVMAETMSCLGIERYEVRYSNRKVLNGLAEYAGISQGAAGDVFRVLDKLEKQGREAVILELGPGRVDKSGDRIAGLSLPKEQISCIERFLNIAETSHPNQLDQVSGLLSGVPVAKQGLDELREIDLFLEGMGVDRAKARIDLSVVRGLGYYTGPVFETVLLDLPEYGSVFSGGRYDHLVSRFSGQPTPGTGSSIGVDRFLAAALKLQMISPRKSFADVIVTTMDRGRMADYFGMASELRASGLRVEVFLGDTRRIPKQLQYADRLGIPVAVICGSDEFDRGEVTVKDLFAGQKQSHDVKERDEWLKAENIQVTVPRKEMISHIKSLLSRQQG